MRPGRQQGLDVGQTAGTVHGVQRLPVVADDRGGHIHAGRLAQHALDRGGLREHHIGGQGEERLAVPHQHRGDPGQRRAGDDVGDHLHLRREVRRRLRLVAHRERDHGEDAAEEGEVALQQRLAAQAEAPLVVPHAARLTPGEQGGDADAVRVDAGGLAHGPAV